MLGDARRSRHVRLKVGGNRLRRIIRSHYPQPYALFSSSCPTSPERLAILAERAERPQP